MPQRSFILMFLVMRFSACEEVKNLTGTVGGNITLPESVQERGFLSYGGKVIADVNKGGFDIYEEKNKNRLQWDRNSGLFTLTELQRNDSGIYAIQSTKGKVFTSSYQLTVYDSVPTPAVEKVSVSSESCSLLCSVDRETTLLWFKDEQKVNRSSSALSLPLTVHKQDFSSSYRCVAANPAENKTLPVHVRTTCGDTNNDTNNSTKPRNYNILIIIFCVLNATLIIIFIIILIMKRKHPVQDKFKLLQAAGRAPVDEVVLYTDTGDSRQAVSGTSDGSSLTAVSYKLVLVT